MRSSILVFLALCLPYGLIAQQPELFSLKIPAGPDAVGLRVVNQYDRSRPFSTLR